MKILVTGAAGFIGSRLASNLAILGVEVFVLYYIYTYFDPNEKFARLREFYGIEADAHWGMVGAIPETGNDGRTAVTFPEMPGGRALQSTLMPNLRFVRMDIVNRDALSRLFQEEKFDKVMNLAAQAGVRYS